MFTLALSKYRKKAYEVYSYNFYIRYEALFHSQLTLALLHFNQLGGVTI